MISYRWIAAGLCFVILFVVSGTQHAFAVFIMPMSRELGWSISSLAITMTICMLVTGFSQPIIGRVADKYGPRNIILLGMTVTGISIMLLAFVSFIWQVYLLYGFLFGFTCMSSGMTATTVLISRWFVKKTSLALTLFQSALAMGWFCLVPLAERLILSYGWRNTWFTLGTTILFTAFIASFLLKEPEKNHINLNMNNFGTVIPLEIAMKTSFFFMLMVMYTICGFTDIPFLTIWVPMSLKFGIDETTASYTLGFMAAIVFLGTIFIGPLPERFGKRMSFSISYVIRAVSLILPFFIVNTVTYYAFTVLFAFSFFGMNPILSAWLKEVFGDKSVGTLLGFLTFVHSMGAAIGIYAFTFLAEVYETVYPVFILSLTLTLMNVAFCFIIKPTIS